ncbi:MAG TPA: glutamate--cysteine ligase [bacterium]|nr:glutamate--cysteine ligase [bacterium]
MPPLDTVPFLTTAQQNPLEEIESHLLARQTKIETWLRQAFLNTPAPFYCSVDLRNAGYKLAPVDTNLFPAGFNNLNPAFAPLCIHALQSAMEHLCPQARGLLLLPERHTRNLHYLESVATLRDLAEQAGYEVKVGSLIEDQLAPLNIDLPSGRMLELLPLERKGKRVEAGGFSPCAVVLNNDLSSGVPDILQDLEQSIIPPLNLGWWQRKKSCHFKHYDDVVNEFATLVGIDPWLINPLFDNCGDIDFMQREGEDCLAERVESLLQRIQAKYAEYGIEREPFVVVKADSGTYGMGVMTARSVDEVRNLNRKERSRMAASKEGLGISRVIVQEGVYTFESIDEAVAEPVVYMIDRFIVGGFYRVHTLRGVDENLNSPGSHFVPLAFADACATPNSHLAPDAPPNRFYAYGVIARLALLAAAREQAELHTQEAQA